VRFLQILILIGVAGLISWLNLPRPSRVPYYGDPTFQPQWQPVPHRVGPFQLIDQNGQPVDERVLDGKITAVHYFFASCGSVCPSLMSRLKEIKARNPQLQILSVTLMPEDDTLAVLADTARRRQLPPGWRLLTGSRQMVQRFAEESLLGGPEIKQRQPVTLLHNERVFLVDGQRRLRGLYNGSLKLDLEHLLEDAGRLD
jgi:protein SCO1/2